MNTISVGSVQWEHTITHIHSYTNTHTHQWGKVMWTMQGMWSRVSLPLLSLALSRVVILDECVWVLEGMFGLVGQLFVWCVFVWVSGAKWLAIGQCIRLLCSLSHRSTLCFNAQCGYDMRTHTVCVIPVCFGTTFSPITHRMNDPTMAFVRFVCVSWAHSQRVQLSGDGLIMRQLDRWPG